MTRNSLEIDFAGIVGIERTEYVRAEGFGLSVGKELTVDLNEFLLCQLTIGTVELEKEKSQ